jgi:DNA-binding GntR family transcriptional regulator
LGELEPGSSINENELAGQLGVSRTPLREALIRLEFEGFVKSEQGKGFSVTALRHETANELNTLVALLECHAMEALAKVGEERLEEIVDELEHLNEALLKEIENGEEQDTERLIQLGTRWHSVLVSANDNRQLHEMLELLRQRMYRHTYAYLRQSQLVPARLTQHAGIISALRDRDIERAVDLSRTHWLRSRNGFQKDDPHYTV